MKASFVIGFHTRRIDNLRQTLRFLQINDPETVAESQLVLVCQDSCDKLFNSFGRYDHFNLNLPCMHLPAVTNFGVEKAVADKIILLESDRILPKNYFSKVLKQLEPGLQITCAMTHKLQRETDDEDIVREKYDYIAEPRTQTTQMGARNMWSGNTAFMKSDFYRVGRMDEAYKGYGWADTDMTFLMDLNGIQSVFRDEIELHLWHEPMTYGQGDQKQMFIDNGLYFCKKWKEPLPDFLREEIAKHKKVIM